MGLAVTRPALHVVSAGKAIEDVELGRGEHQLSMLVLAVEGEQARADRPQVAGGGGAALDEGAGPTRCRDPAPEHDLLGLLREPFAKLGELRLAQQAGRQGEHPLDVGLLGTRANDLRARLAPHQEVERVGEDRLARAGLAGDRVQPAREAKLRALD